MQRVIVALLAAIIIFEAGALSPASPVSASTSPPVDTSVDPDYVLPEDPPPVGEELIERRTETSRTYVTGDGELTTELYPYPIHYQADGSTDWLPIDVGFEAGIEADRVAASTRAPVTVSIDENKAADGFLSVERDGHRISYGLPAAALPGLATARPTFDGERADLSTLLPGVGLRVFAQATGAKSFLVLDQPPATNAWTFTVSHPTLTPKQAADGSIEFVDADGTAVAHMPMPYMVDASGDTSGGVGRFSNHVAYTLANAGPITTVTITADADFLKGATYPVYIDPSITFYPGNGSYGDAFVSREYPTQNFGDYVRPDLGYHELWLGQDPSNSNNYNHDYFKFDVSSIAGTTVDSAQLRLYPYHQYQSPTTTWVGAATGSWTESGITWNNQPGLTSITSASTSAGSYAYFTVTGTVQSWVNGSTNNGFRVHENNNNQTYWKRLLSSEHSSGHPALIVTYHVPTATVASPTGNAWVTSRLLDWTYADAEGHAQSHFEVQVDDTSTFTSPVSSSGQVASSNSQWSIPTSVPLTNATTYYWRARVKDGTSWSAWSSSGSFRWNGSNPVAAISSPLDGTTLTDTFAIVGTASDAGFINYQLHYGVGPSPTSWISIGTNPRTTPVTNGTLGSWDTSALDENRYTIRLLVTDGQLTSEARRTVVVGGNLGRRAPQTFETWDLGAGDELAVNVASGNLVVSHPLVTLPFRGDSLSLSLAYNSQSVANVGLGTGWQLNVQRRLVELADGRVRYTDGDGSRWLFNSPVTVGGVTTYTPVSGIYATLVKTDANTDGEFALTWPDQSVDTFDLIGSAGRLVRSADRHGNDLDYTYHATSGVLETITDPAGRSVSLTWDTAANPDRLTAISDWARIDASGVVLTDPGAGSARTYRFFHSGTTLIGWSDPLNTTGSCPTGGSHLTCLTYASGLLGGVAKTQTVTNADLTTTPRALTTAVTYSANRVASVKDAQQVSLGGAGVATTFTIESITRVRVDRPTTTIAYDLIGTADRLGRVTSVWRYLNPTTAIERRTTYDATYVIEPASVIDNAGAILNAPSRTVSYTYVPNSPGLVARMVEPLTATTSRWTEYTYNANHDVTSTVVSQDGSATLRTETRYCYSSAAACPSATGLDLLAQVDSYVDGVGGTGAGLDDHDTDIRTDYGYDAYGQQISVTRHNRDAAGAVLDDREDRIGFDANGNLTTEIVNYANGSVTSPGDDVTPNASTLARTDLTTAHTYDTAGNRVSSADPRRAVETAKGTTLATDDFITRWTFDALNRQLTQRTPTTPGLASTQRTSSSTYDELGAARSATDFGGLVAATEFDRVGRALRTFERPAGGSVSVTSISTYDADGRVLSAKDRRQVGDASLGLSTFGYDGLGRQTSVTAADGTAAEAADITGYDGLDRRASLEVGAGSAASLLTTYGYDLGGRTTTTDEGFTCTTESFDYRDLPTASTSGLAGGTCADAADKRIVTHTHDGLGRLTRSEVTLGTGLGDRTVDDVFDAAGNQRSVGVRTAGTTSTTTFAVNRLDQVSAETRPDGSTAKAAFDAAGNAVDRCYWKPGITVGACYAVGTTPWTDPPTQVTTAAFDALNQRVTLVDAAAGAITTYDPEHNYAVDAVYRATANGREHQALYAYDDRHRLTGITFQTCTANAAHACTDTPVATGSDGYAYDDADNRTQVIESNGATSTDRRYCYDARNQLAFRNTGAACSSIANDESATYDDAGNRLSAASGGTTTNFAYDAAGLLCDAETGAAASCTGGNVVHDTAGRIESRSGWTFAYDAEGRLTSACKSATCAAGSDKVEFAYDGEGHRTKIVATAASGTVTTTEFRYQNGAVVEERVNGTVVRQFMTDEAGAISKLIVPAGQPDAGTYLVTWNGHGDALNLLRVNADGTTTLANSFTYDTWGRPTTTVHNGIGDLGFRYLYVGQFDVQWDDQFGLGLHYMHARHYAPALGRFLQPDPPREEQNLFAYATSNPISRVDPSGEMAVWANCGGSGIEAWDAGVGLTGVSAWILTTCGPMFVLHWWISWLNVNTGRSGVIDKWAWPASNRWSTVRNILTGKGVIQVVLNAKGWVLFWGIPTPVWSARPFALAAVN